MDELISILKEIGLTDGEIKVYNALLGLKESTVGSIIKDSGISASKIYYVLNKLIDKGLVNYYIKEKIKYFILVDPKYLLTFLENKKTSISENQAKIKKILPLLNKESSSKKPLIEITTAKAGMLLAIQETLNIKEGESIYILANKFVSFGFSDIWQEYHNNAFQKKMKMNIIYDYESWNNKSSETMENRKKRELYYPLVLPEEYGQLADLKVAGNNVFVSNSEGKNKFSIIIRDENFANSIKKLLSVLFKIANIPEGFNKNNNLNLD